MSDLKGYVHYRPYCFSPGDFKKPQKRVNYAFPPSKRVLNPTLIEEKKVIKKNLSQASLVNNGKWNNMMSRTSKEALLCGRIFRRVNPRTHLSNVFDNQNRTMNTELKHTKSTIFTKYSLTTQIYSLPGGVKRPAKDIKDDKKSYEHRRNCSNFMKRNREFGPVIVDKDPPGINRSLFLGGYGYRGKTKSSIDNYTKK